MTMLILTGIWLLSYVIAAILLACNGIPPTLGNFLLALTPGLNTLIAIKLSIKALKNAHITMDMKTTIKTIFKTKINY